MIDLNRVAVFVRVVEEGSFTRAAKALALPNSTVSRTVAKLEHELGVQLLHRTTRKLGLTDIGQHFFERMHAVIGAAEEATRAVAGFAKDPRGLVRLTAPPSLGNQELPPIVEKIVRRYPGITLELHLTNRVVDLVGEGFDLAIRGGVLEDSSLVGRRIVVSELAVFGAPAYLARRGRPRTPADLLRHDCLAYGSRGSKIPWRLAGPRGDRTIAVSGPIVCDEMSFLREAVIAGLGLAMLPIQFMASVVAAGGVERVLPRYRYPGGALWVVWPSHKLVPARVVAVREMLVDELVEAYR